MKKCKHSNKHTQYAAGWPGMIQGYFIAPGKYISHETPATSAIITTYCSDCGKFIRQVEVNGK